MATEEISDGDILTFLRKTDDVSWPSGLRPSERRELPGFFETHFVDGDWEFFDLFGGDVTDVGFEIVLYKREHVWGASYRGGVISNLNDVQEIFDFLGEALKAPNDHENQLRGPRHFESPKGDFSYEYAATGSFSSFFGVERIFRSKVLVYERNLAGGRFGSRLYGEPISFYDKLF